MASNDTQDPTRELVQLLLDKVDGDTYPSITMMDLIEEMVTPEEAAAYAEILMSKIRSDTYPSMDLIDRVRAVGPLAASRQQEE